MTEWTTIPLTSSTRDDLKERKANGQSWDGVVTELLNTDSPVTCELTDEQIDEIASRITDAARTETELKQHASPPQS